MSRRLVLALVVGLVVLALPAGCVFGGTTADELEESLGRFGMENVSCRESDSWDFECSGTLTNHPGTEYVSGFMLSGGDVKCATGPVPVERGLPDQTEFCARFSQ